MKKIIFILLAVISSLSFQANAQSNLRIGHIDYEKLLENLPSKLQADKEFEAIVNDGQKEIEELQIALEDSYEKYMAAKDSLSPIVQEMREKKLMEQQQIIQMKSQSLQSDIEILTTRFYAPIEDNVKKAVAIVAKKHNLNYVLETTSLLYSEGGFDITEEVKIELIKLEDARLAAGN